MFSRGPVRTAVRTGPDRTGPDRTGLWKFARSGPDLPSPDETRKIYQKNVKFDQIFQNLFVKVFLNVSIGLLIDSSWLRLRLTSISLQYLTRFSTFFRFSVKINGCWNFFGPDLDRSNQRTGPVQSGPVRTGPDLAGGPDRTGKILAREITSVDYRPGFSLKRPGPDFTLKMFKNDKKLRKIFWGTFFAAYFQLPQV